MPKKTKKKKPPYPPPFYCISHKITNEQRFIGLSDSAKVLYSYMCKVRNDKGNGAGTFYHSDEQFLSGVGWNITKPTNKTKREKPSKNPGFEKFRKARRELKTANLISYKQTRKSRTYTILDYYLLAIRKETGEGWNIDDDNKLKQLQDDIPNW